MIRQFRHLAALWVAGSLVLALVTWACFQLGLNVATTGFGFLIVIVLLSHFDSLVSSVFFSIIAVGCLDYFFMDPLFSFTVASIEDIAALAAFLITSLSITALVRRQRVAFLLDLTERKRAEQALRESTEALRRSEERWRTVFQNAPVGIGTLNLDGRFVTANPTFQRMLGYGEDELRNLTGLDITHEDDRAATRRLIDEMTAGGRQSYQIEKRYRRKDGQVIWVLVNTSIIPASGSMPAFFAGVVVDMTERMRAQEERERLRQLEVDLAHMNRLGMMGELAASLAHEITQPIASTRNNARAAMNFLDRQPPYLGEAREALGCVVGDADRAGDIIGRIRDHIKKAPPRSDRFDLNAAIDEVIVLGRSAITENGVSVQTGLADGLSPVQGDRVQVQQVVLNLVLNAVEAMGSVEAGARELSISTEQNRTDGVRVAVRDSGPGIAPTHLERVFDAFYTTKSSGTGMGLSICRSIINAHGGRLWAEANEPRGAVFQFTLPGPIA
jgi:PAS domain S-box-containing protein